MAPARHRAPARRPGRWALPPSAALSLWLAENAPGGAAGLALALGAGLAFSLFWPLAALVVLEAPGALVPASWRASRRRGDPARPHVPNRLRRAVYAADRHACAYCRSSRDLQLDHIRPWAAGGRTSFFNTMTLCRSHNLVKSDYWASRDGRHAYRPFEGYDNAAVAASVLAFELRHRRSLARFIRAAAAL